MRRVILALVLMALMVGLLVRMTGCNSRPRSYGAASVKDSSPPPPQSHGRYTSGFISEREEAKAVRKSLLQEGSNEFAIRAQYAATFGDAEVAEGKQFRYTRNNAEAKLSLTSPNMSPEQQEALRYAKLVELLDRARQQQRNMQFDAALATIDELLFIEPTNQSALLLREVLSNIENESSYRNANQRLEAATRALAPADSPSVPSAEIVGFPADWPRAKREVIKNSDELIRATAAHLTTQQQATFNPQQAFAESRAIESQFAIFPGSRAPLEDEIWVIQKPANWDTAPAGSDIPGCGALMTILPDTTDQVPVPLEHTDVRATIAGYIGATTVTQKFHNPFDVKIEAVYVFPLPQSAAVNEFVMTIGERRIRGIIREREEAEQIYAEARAAGHVASLLTQERPNVFRQKVANIEPGRAIDIDITYFNTLPYRDGSYEYTFPMVVGPRFNPPHISDGVGAVARGADGASGQATEVQYLAPSERSGHDVSILVEIDAGVEIGDIRCRSHTIEVMRDGASHATIRLAGESTIPNKDFVLRYDVASDDVQSAMVVSRDAATGEGYFSMLLVPPQTVSEANRRPMELVFVIDCSGSMSGEPIAQAKSAIERGLELLAPGDTFQIIRFSEGASALGTHPLEATPANIRSARSHVRALSGGGGTMMIEGIKAALDFPHDPERTRFVVFLTDGFIGNEHEILGEMRSRLDTSRVFSFGVGSAPNRFLIERMARLGRGAVAYLALEDSGAEVMEAFFERAARPALAHLAIDWGGAQVADVHPAELPDLYAGRPVVVTGRIAAFGDEPVRVSGDTPRGNVLIEVEESTADATDSLRAMRAVWARSRIADLLDEATFEPVADLPAQVRDLALSYELMSPYTAFVAVDSTRVTEGDHGISTVVPVHVPDGVRYDTTVQGGG